MCVACPLPVSPFRTFLGPLLSLPLLLAFLSLLPLFLSPTHTDQCALTEDTTRHSLAGYITGCHILERAPEVCSLYPTSTPPPHQPPTSPANSSDPKPPPTVTTPPLAVPSNLD